MKALIEALQPNEEVTFAFQNEEFTITRFSNMLEEDGVKGCSIKKKDSSFKSMNIDKVTSKYITVYGFDMMIQKTTFKFPIDDLEGVMVVDHHDYIK